MFIIKYRKIFFLISFLLVVSAVFSVFYFGLNLGIDFIGGSIMEISYDGTRPEIDVVKENVEKVVDGNVLVQPTGEKGFLIRTKSAEDGTRELILSVLPVGTSSDESEESGKVAPVSPKEERFNLIGPTIGSELRSKALVAIVMVIFAIILLIAYVFRQVSDPVSSWKYGVVAIVALAHDIIIPTGIFAYLGYEIDSLFIIALLAILGLSVNDTIVVFDRIRENLKNRVSRSFEETVGKSLNETFTRSINTSITTLFVLLTLYFIGPASTQNFALALALGIFFGTYSSIFLASPLLVAVEEKTYLQ